MKIQFTLVAMLAFALTLSRSDAVVLYSDTFETSPYAGGTPRWSVYRDDGTQVLYPGPHALPHYVNWLASGGPSLPASGYIFVQHQSGAVASEYLLHTRSPASLNINPEAVSYESLYVSWLQNESGATDATRLFAIQVGDEWYVASGQPSYVVGTQAFLDFHSATWNSLSVTTGVGGALAVDTSLTFTYDQLFSGGDTLNSLGFYVNMPASDGVIRTVRWDNLEMTSGLLWIGSSGAGGAGTWQSASTWATGIAPNYTLANWANQQTAIFGAVADEDPGVVSITGNVIVRSLEFYEDADGYTFRGDVAVGTDGVPVRTIQINTATPYRSIYLHPDAHLTVGGDADTGLRIFKSGNMQIYGGGLLTIDRNGMVRTESNGDMIVNDGATVEVKAGGQFNASRDMFIGNYLTTFEGAGGDAHLILDGGSGTTRTGGARGDLYVGGPSGTGRVTIKNNGVFTVAALAGNGVRFGGNGVLSIESGGTLFTKKIGKTSDATGEAVVRFDGGKVVINAIPSAGTGNFIGNDINHVYVAAGGAIIDTAGFNATIAAPIEHDPATVGVDGGLTKLGLGSLTLTGGTANTFTGAVTIKAGRLITAVFDSLGDSTNAASNLVLDGGTWEHTGGASTNRSITVTANGGTLAGSTAWRVNGQVVGAANSTLYIAGNAWLSGVNTSTFFGNIDVLSGEFLVRRAASLGSAVGGVTVRNGATFSLDHNGTGGGDNSSSDNVYSDNLVLDAGATLRTRGANIATNASTYAGSIDLTGPGDSMINVSNIKTEIAQVPDLTVTGVIQGAGGLIKNGSGRLVLTNENTYAGKTTVAEGALALALDSVFGEAGSLASPWIEVSTGARFTTEGLDLAGGYTFTAGTLSGSGSFAGNVTVDSSTRIKIGGTSTGNQGMTNLASAGNLAGTLTFEGDLTLEGAALHFQIGGESAGLGYDFLDVKGAFTADSNTQIIVEWANGYSATAGQSFDLINWESLGDPLWGGFDAEALAALLPELGNASWYWDTSKFLDQGVISVAPEPGRTMLLVMGFSLFFLRRHRRATPAFRPQVSPCSTSAQ